MLPLTLQKDTLHSTLTEMATLKRSITTYYYQVQGEMAVKGYKRAILQHEHMLQITVSWWKIKFDAEL